jgi:hypothetical protein
MTYYQKHRAKLLAYQRVWAKAHPERRKVNARVYYLRNLERIRAKARAYYWAHHPRVLA